jgi:MFS family permease
VEVTVQPLSRTRLLAYSAGQLVSGMFYAFNNFTLPLYLGHFTSNNIIIGWLSSTRSLEQAVTQPIVGALSDRTWTRFGRRAPFFLATMPFVALLLVFNSFIPTGATAPDWLPVVVVTVFIFSVLFSIGVDPYYALLIDVTTPEERGSKNGIAQVFGFAGQVILLLLAVRLWEANPTLVFVIVAVAVAAGFITVTLGVREPRVLAHREFVKEPETSRVVSLRRGRLWVHNNLQPFKPIATPAMRRFAVNVMSRAIDVALYVVALYDEQREAVKLLGGKFLYQFGISAAVPFLTLFVVDEIGTNGWREMLGAVPMLAASPLAGVDAQGISQLMAAVLLLTTAVFAVPVGLLGDRFGKKRIFALGLLVMGVTGLLAAFATNIPQLLVYLLFLGFGNAALTVLFGVYLADLIPAERVGEFTGLTAFAETGGVALSILTAGELLNLNLFNLKYRIIFIITGVFLLLALVAVTFVKARLAEIKPPAVPAPDAAA